MTTTSAKPRRTKYATPEEAKAAQKARRIDRANYVRQLLAEAAAEQTNRPVADIIQELANRNAQYAISYVRRALNELDNAIGCTPTGLHREALTIASIVLRCAQDVISNRPGAKMPFLSDAESDVLKRATTNPPTAL